MQIHILLIAGTVLLIASIIDIRTREVPEWLSYTFILLALGNAIIESVLQQNILLLLYSFGGGAIFFAIGMILYYARQWGGGDAKLSLGLGMLFATQPGFYIGPSLKIPFLAVLWINILFIGALYGIIYSLIVGFIHRKKIKTRLKSHWKSLLPYTILAAIVFLISIFLQQPTQTVVQLTALLIIITPWLLIYIRVIEKYCLTKYIGVQQLTEGEWLAKDISLKKKIIVTMNPTGITQNQIQILKKYRIQKVLVKIGIPFVPAIFGGVLLTLARMNPLLLW